MFKQLETERLRLVTFDQSDLEGYTLLLTDPETFPFIVDDGPIDPDSVASRIRKNRIATQLGTAFYWTARLKGSEEYVGFVALHAVKSKRPVLSYAVVPVWRRKGLASESIRVVVDFVIETLRKEAVLARTHLENHASQALLKSLGFQLAGKVEWSGSERLEFVFEKPESTNR